MEPGTGKTLSAVRAAEEPVLVICRRDDFMTWRLELEREGKSCYAIDCTKAIENVDGSDWVLVAYDLVKQPNVARFIKSVRFRTVIADEGHQIKRWSAKRTKAVYRATRHIPNRMLLTGTPITNHLLDVFSQTLFVDDGKTFGSDEWSFKKRYYIKDPTGPGWFPLKRAKDEIAEKLKRIAFSVKADDVLDLPPTASVVKSAPMSPSQTYAYETVLKDWQYEIDVLKVPIEIDHVIVQMAKLRQISSGFIYYHEDYQCKQCDWHGQMLQDGCCPCCESFVEKLPTKVEWFSDPGKLKLLFDLLTHEDYLLDKQKVVVWCAHTAEIFRIVDDYNRTIGRKRGDEALSFTGSLATKTRERVRQKFRDDADVRLFVGQVDAGVGMNELVVSDTAVYFSNSFKVSSRLQSAARTRRIGSEIHERITYYDLVSEGSVDVKLIKGLTGAINIAEEILARLRKGATVREVLK